MLSPVLRILGWAYVALCIALLTRASDDAPEPVTPFRATAAGTRPVTPQPSRAVTAAEWFRKVKPYCNAVEISVAVRSSPPPGGLEGAGYHAACLALAGRIDDARRAIDAVDASDRYRAAGIVFNVGHEIADAGDDRSAGPIMELVIDYWPNHYMALYHAAMAEYMLGRYAESRKNLEAFLQFYHQNDGWRANGVEVLGRLKSSDAAAPGARRPREP